MSEYPDKLSDYDIIESNIGAGGYAVVHKAQCEQGIVALKVPKASDDPVTMDQSVFDHLYAEAKLWYKLSQRDVPGVVKLYAYGSSPYPWMAMEYMEGGTLKDRIGKLHIDDTVYIGAVILKALHYAHHMGVIHRDIKPANILFDFHNEPNLSDWGLGKILLRSDDTQAEMFKGTLQYSAPEQFDPARPTDWRTDIFQTGAVLYHLLTGQPLLPSDMFLAMKVSCEGHFKDVRELNPDVPERVAKAVMKALKVNRTDRWSDASMFLGALTGADIKGNRTHIPMSVEKNTPHDRKVIRKDRALERCPDCMNYISTDNKRLKCKDCGKLLCEACEGWIDKEEHYRGVKLSIRYPLCEPCYHRELMRLKTEIDETIEDKLKMFKTLVTKLRGSFRAYLLDEDMKVIKEVSLDELKTKVKTVGDDVNSIIIDGEISKDIVEAAKENEIKTVIGKQLGKGIEPTDEVALILAEEVCRDELGPESDSQ